MVHGFGGDFGSDFGSDFVGCEVLISPNYLTSGGSDLVHISG
ncbi:MAG: hypothetical protein ACK5RD_00925 [Aphanizomenon sp.]